MRGASRRLASAPLGLLTPRLRAQTLEQWSGRMIAERPTSNGVLRFFAPSPLLLDRAAGVLTKEPDMIRWIDGMEIGSVLWDVGANVGVFTLYAALQARAVVLAFEPSAANFFILARNVQLNELSASVTAYCLAFSDETTLGVLNLSSPEPGSAMAQFGRPGETSRYWNGQGASAPQGMIAFTIDDFVARFDPPFPTHLKMDVDGLEWPILQGATKTLRDPRLRSTMIELSITNREERDQAIACLRECGLVLVSTGAPQGTETEQAANHLFERPRHG
jgi:FkbM family methyltransferase